MPRPHLAEPDTPFADDGAAAPRPQPPAPALARTHHGWLIAALRLRFGREAAEDLAQETFLRASQHQPTAIRSPKAWLLAIARNVVRDQARRRAVRLPLTNAEGAAELTDAPTPSDQEETLLLKQVILALPPTLRETFLLSRVAGLTYEEIAERLAISPKTVEWRMSKALALCAARLKA